MTQKYFKYALLVGNITAFVTTALLLIYVCITLYIAGCSPFTSHDLLLFLGILAITLFGGTFLVLRMNMKSLVLSARLDESTKRENEIQGKNRLLESEIAERRRVEDALMDSEERFRGIFENIHDIYYRADADDNLVMLSPSSTKLLGYDSTEELIGRPLRSFWFRPEERERFMMTLAENGSVNDYELALMKKDGTPFYVSTSSYFYYDSSGNRLGTEGICRDIADRKRAAEELRRAHDLLKGYSDKLEEEVYKRTREAHEAQLEAESANRAKSAFLTNMSHELKTPLTAVIGFSQAMLDSLCGPLSTKQAEYLDYIFRSGKHLHRLIDDILEMSTIEAGKMELDVGEFSVKDLIADSLLMFREKAKRHDVAVTSDIEEGLENIAADALKVKQVLCNLLSNALKFTPDGRKIHVRAESRSGGDFVEFSVQDSGIGISSEDQSRLFQPFTQLDSSYTKRYEGTGLGLSLCRKIVELHGGNIRFESEPGKGSTFYFTIPRNIRP